MEREQPLRQKHRRSSHSSGVGVRNENRRLSTSPRDSRLLYSSHSSDHQRGDSGRDDSPLSSIGHIVIDIKKGHLSLFVDMGHGVFGFIDMIDEIYESYYSSTDIYTSTHKI